MSNRRSYNIFFVLALITFAVVAVLSRERDARERGLEERARTIIRTLLPPAPVELEADTIWRYVDADSSGAIPQERSGFETSILVRDIGPRDTATLFLTSVARNGMLVSPSIVAVGWRQGVGGVANHTIAFPVRCTFDSTGSYDMTFTLHTRRVHRRDDSTLVYHESTIPVDLIPPEYLEAAETSRLHVRMCVEDTSLRTPAAMQPLSIAAERPHLQGALGVWMENRLQVSQSFFDPVIRVLRGPGRIDTEHGAGGRTTYVWRGAPRRASDTIVLEARLQRGAGSKDIAQTRFSMEAAEPLMMSALPHVVYEGELLECNFLVDGLRDPLRYSWRLSERASNGTLFHKDSGRGTVLQYRIPAGFAGKKLQLVVTYDGRPFQCILADSYMEAPSVFEFPILEPPMKVGMDLPGRVPAMYVFRFTAHQYHDPRFRNDRPVSSQRDIAVHLLGGGGRQLATIIGMNTYGDFEFTLQNPGVVKPGGELVELTIRIKGSVAYSRRVFLYR